ncbi:hypothetical protein QQF64_023435 [Cirrhinus molitorella]|uniref:Secreted protein n=1 Tax=Cirrhinus molitorella TaxID=172907 RepID=A0ABR3L570_9TELE
MPALSLFWGLQGGLMQSGMRFASSKVSVREGSVREQTHSSVESSNSIGKHTHLVSQMTRARSRAWEKLIALCPHTVTVNTARKNLKFLPFGTLHVHASSSLHDPDNPKRPKRPTTVEPTNAKRCPVARSRTKQC